ncbi:UbiA prenyltransferase family protein [Flavobacterium sp.]|uniref:UbiA prenyltransferase family protein n=1 Tax=Flavobacterium sp. TaxID=239 RepID=UPI0032632DD9
MKNEKFWTILKLLRYHQWIKNLFLLIPLIFSTQFLDPYKIFLCVMAIISFSMVASTVYIFNDLNDIEEDKLHPRKKNRPLASGLIQPIKAKIIAILILITALTIAFLINWQFFIIVIFYIILNILYTIIGKKQPIWDILILASFYIIRVIGGGFAISVPITSWLLLTTFFAALFLGSGKRYIELLTHGKKSRKVLENYSEDFLKYTLYLSSFCTILFYSIYSMTKSFYFELSIVFVVTGFLMYFYSLFGNKIHEDPVSALIENKSMFVISALWGIYIFILLILKL